MLVTNSQNVAVLFLDWVHLVPHPKAEVIFYC